MSAIANHSRKTIRYAFLSGGILLTGWALFSSTATQREIAPQGAQANSHIRGALHRSKWFQFGRASWYGSPFQGQPTASGEAFDMYQMTCAHRSLPLGALIRVTNLHNHRSVVVRVNDRGPLVETRIVDLSYAAAKILGFHGMTRVRLDLIDPSPSPAEIARLSWPEQARN